MSDLRNYEALAASRSQISAAKSPMSKDAGSVPNPFIPQTSAAKYPIQKDALSFLKPAGHYPQVNDLKSLLDKAGVPPKAGNPSDVPRIAKGTKHLYRPLDFDSFEIRLLQVQDENSGDGVTCSLVYASLIKPPEYTALSYCWGDASKTTKITIENWGDVEVTTNLEEALKSVRPLNIMGLGKISRSKLFWVDALCINQQDSLERSQQVRQMRQIYSRAKEVISWVPCASEDAVAYLVMNQFYGNGCETTDREPSRRRTTAASLLGSEDTFRERSQSWVAVGWGILEKFFSNAYWKRVWVIQEVTVASKVTVLCGKYEIPWDDVATILARWRKIPESVPLGKRSYLKAMHLVDFRDRFLVKREPISLLDAMRWSYQTEATDPRDKIFALLGICHDGATYVPVPNYKQPLEEIIADMSRTMMSYDRSLDLMCLKGTSLDEEGKFPSWTPNWANLWSGSLHYMTVHEADYENWHANFSFDPILEGSTDQFLKVKGRRCGQITQLTSEMARPGPNGELILTPEIREPWISSSLSKYLIQDVITVQDSIWKTLTMGLLHSKMNKEEAALCFSKLWKPEGRGAVRNYALIEWIDRNAWFEHLTWTLQDWSQAQPWKLTPAFPRTPTPPWKGWDSIPSGDKQQSQGNGSTSLEKGKDNSVRKLVIFIETIEKVLGSGMRLAVIKCPRRDDLAMVPPGTRRDDEVWMIKGCSVPIVLRRQKQFERRIEQFPLKVVGGVYFDDTQALEIGPFGGFQKMRMRASQGDWDEEKATEMIYLC
jgi:hypothetical protein